jgi:hypothetical protein
MLRSLSHRLLGVALAGSLTFGATQALASSDTAVRARSGSCERTGYAYLPLDGCPECGGSGGYCDGWNEDCVCV